MPRNWSRKSKQEQQQLRPYLNGVPVKINYFSIPAFLRLLVLGIGLVFWLRSMFSARLGKGYETQVTSTASVSLDNLVATQWALFTQTPVPELVHKINVSDVEVKVTPVPAITPTARSNDANIFDRPVSYDARSLCDGCIPVVGKILLSRYWPALGGDNCFLFENGVCKSDTFSGVPWESVINLAVACPFELPVGTWVSIPRVGDYLCLDRGGSIVKQSNGVYKIDLLSPNPGEWQGKEYDVTFYVPARLGDRMR